MSLVLVLVFIGFSGEGAAGKEIFVREAKEEDEVWKVQRRERKEQRDRGGD